MHRAFKGVGNNFLSLALRAYLIPLLPTLSTGEGGRLFSLLNSGGPMTSLVGVADTVLLVGYALIVIGYAIRMLGLFG